MIKELILLILSALYSLGVGLRNMLFDWGILKSSEFDIPIICVGNITVGGTGKTPMTEMILSYMSKHYTIAVLSRGYGRRTKGYLEVEDESHWRDVGDEPMQIKLKFPNVVVVVCEDRVEGINAIKKRHPEVTLIVMDDGFQHRWVKAKINVIMIDATRPPHEDKMLPSGALRDSVEQLYRANYFVVSKCPDNMTPLDRRILQKMLAPMAYQKVYFTRIESFKPTAIFEQDNSDTVSLGEEVIALAGIGNPRPFITSLEEQYRVVASIINDDHHIYKVKDIKEIERYIARYPKAKIITTEKDAVKMLRSKKISELVRSRIFFIPIDISFVNDSNVDFLKLLHSDVECD